jgi:hypothetical protein
LQQGKWSLGVIELMHGVGAAGVECRWCSCRCGDMGGFRIELVVNQCLSLRHFMSMAERVVPLESFKMISSLLSMLPWGRNSWTSGSVFHVAVAGQDGAGGSRSMEHGPVGGCIVVGNDFEDTGADGYTGWFIGGFFTICCNWDGSFEELVIPENGGVVGGVTVSSSVAM